MKDWELFIEDRNARWVSKDVSHLVNTLERLCGDDEDPLDMSTTRVTLRRTRKRVHPSMQVRPLRTSKWA